MSAFIVSDEQLFAVVNVWADAVTILKTGEEECCPPSLVRCLEVATILAKENVRSVNWRYNERTRVGKVKFVRKVSYPGINALQAIRYLECIDYQSCERPDYGRSAACSLNRAMRLDLFRLYVGSTQIERMEWSI